MKTSYFTRKIIFCISILLVFNFSTIFAQKRNSISNERKNFKQWTWDEVNSQTPWSARAGLQVLYLNDTFYLFGGRTPLDPNIIPVPGASIIHGDVWSSSVMGVTWDRILESNPTLPGLPPNPNLTSHWANRSYFQAVKKDVFIRHINLEAGS